MNTDDKNADPFAKLIEMACDIATELPESPLGDYVRIAREIITVMDADEIRKDWLQAPGKLNPNFVCENTPIEDYIAAKKDVEFEVEIDPVTGKIGNIIPDVVIQDNRIEPTGPMRGDDPPHEEQATRTYSVTWRRPASAYAHDEIEAVSVEDALMKAKALLDTGMGRGGGTPFFECNTDSMDACDWISVEPDFAPDNNEECVEWEPVKLSPGTLVEALNKLKLFATNSADLQNKELRLSMEYVERIATEALNKAIPMNEPHTYDDERDAS